MALDNVVFDSVWLNALAGDRAASRRDWCRDRGGMLANCLCFGLGAQWPQAALLLSEAREGSAFLSSRRCSTRFQHPLESGT